MSRGSFHLVTVQGCEEFVSSAGLSAKDAQSLLAMDKLLHRAAGWRVTEAQGVLVARRGDVVRLMTSRRFDAANERVRGARSRRVA